MKIQIKSFPLFHTLNLILKKRFFFKLKNQYRKFSRNFQETVVEIDTQSDIKAKPMTSDYMVYYEKMRHQEFGAQSSRE